MKRCAFLSMDNLEGFYSNDDLLFAPLKSAGWQVEEVSWRKADVNWDDYDLVIIRTTWDYQQDPDGFMTCLKNIEASSAQLQNSLNIVQWNISKKYLQELQNQGVPIVPTLWFQSFSLSAVEAGFEQFETQQIVLKPLISANADHTYRLTHETLRTQVDMLSEVFDKREFMLQPFIPAIVEEGEYSLFYFAGNYSHAILKQPKSGDFRVQEEHGGRLTKVEPNEEMLTTARHCLAALPEDVFYARVDLVSYQGEFVVMEIELIEPSLYFNMDPESPQRFVDALVAIA